jgi:hypothetical protein
LLVIPQRPLFVIPQRPLFVIPQRPLFVIPQSSVGICFRIRPRLNPFDEAETPPGQSHLKRSGRVVGWDRLGG